MSDQLVASLYVHQQLVRLAHVVLGTNIVVFSLFWNVFGFTWMRVISLQWNESALSISPLSIAVMLSISYSHSLSATLSFYNVCASVFPSLRSLSLSLYFVSLFSLYFFSLSCLHLLRGRAGRQLAVRRPLLLASFALTREKEVLLLMESFISRETNLFLTLRNCFLAKTPSSLKTAQ